MNGEQEEKMRGKRNVLPGILAAAAVGAAEFLITFRLYREAQSGRVISARFSSGQPAAFLLQCLMEFLFPAVLLIVSAFLLKKRFPAEMYMLLEGKWQRIASAILGAAVLGIAGYAVIAKQDRTAVLLSLIYYLMIVAFAEEFVLHDVCTYFVRSAPWPLRYLVPNVIFALLHIFSYTGWGTVSGGAVLGFFLNGGFLGCMLGGCVFQLLKEKSGSIWLPVLLHCLMDYSAVLKY